MIKELNPPDIVALSVGMQNTVCYIFVAVLANFIGVILDAFKGSAIVTEKAVIYPSSAYVTLFAVLACFAVASLISSFYGRETHGKCVYRP